MDAEIKNLDAKGLRRFAVTVGSAIALVFGAGLPFLFDLVYPKWPWIVAAVLIAWGLVAPVSLGPVYRGWMRVSLLINKVTTPLVLAVVFVVLLFPVGLIFRIIGRDAMNRRFDPGAATYRDGVDGHSTDDLERPF